ncbi:MAG: MSCRAMM family protein [Egibacteraceae bacterium]
MSEDTTSGQAGEATISVRIRLEDADGGLGQIEVVVCPQDGEETTLVTDESGFATGTLPAGIATVEPRPFVRGCVRFVPDTPRAWLQLDPDCTTELELSYRNDLAEIRITPHLRDGMAPVPGVEFQLYRGNDLEGTPLVRTTRPEWPTASFRDLEAGEYTVTATAPASFHGRPVRSDCPQALRLHVLPGQVVQLDRCFEFVLATGRVTGTVVKEATGGGIEDVPVMLSPRGDGERIGPVCSRDGGCFEFPDVPAGDYTVALEHESVTVAGVQWTAVGRPPRVSVSAQAPEGVAQLRLERDLHLLRGIVTDPDDQTIAHAVVEIRRSPDAEPFAVTVADDDGRYEWRADEAGTYYVSLREDDGVAARCHPVAINSVAYQNLRAARSSSDSSGSSDSSSRLGGSFDRGGDPTPFPILVGSVDVTGGTARTSDRSAVTGAGAIVEAAIRDVLGYRARPADPKGFVTALAQSFTCAEVAGHTECTWTPRSYYASTIRADLGALTGAQASIYERARVAVEAALPLLEGIKPLLADADQEDIEAARALVRSRLTDIVAELSLEGGPRIQRVDELFLRLTGQPPAPTGAPPVLTIETLKKGSELRLLRDRFGIARNRVNTIAEEENFTDFLIIVDHVSTLFGSWQTVRGFFVHNGGGQFEPFLGTQLVLLSRQLSVVAETVQETYFVMDSVFLGAAERQTVLLRLSVRSVDETIFLAELLDWVDQFATEEGPRLIADAGKDGVNAFTPTIRRLAELVQAASDLQQRPGGEIPPTFFTARVELALAQLASQLCRAATLARAIDPGNARDEQPIPAV